MIYSSIKWELNEKIHKEEFNSKYYDDENEHIKLYKSLSEKIESEFRINELYEEYLNSIFVDELI